MKFKFSSIRNIEISLSFAFLLLYIWKKAAYLVDIILLSPSWSWMGLSFHYQAVRSSHHKIIIKRDFMHMDNIPVLNRLIGKSSSFSCSQSLIAGLKPDFQRLWHHHLWISLLRGMSWGKLSLTWRDTRVHLLSEKREEEENKKKK